MPKAINFERLSCLTWLYRSCLLSISWIISRNSGCSQFSNTQYRDTSFHHISHLGVGSTSFPWNICRRKLLLAYKKKVSKSAKNIYSILKYDYAIWYLKVPLLIKTKFLLMDQWSLCIFVKVLFRTLLLSSTIVPSFLKSFFDNKQNLKRLILNKWIRQTVDAANPEKK